MCIATSGTSWARATSSSSRSSRSTRRPRTVDPGRSPSAVFLLGRVWGVPRRYSTSGCAKTWARCSCSSLTAFSRPTFAGIPRSACCVRPAARESPLSTTAMCTRATTSSTRRISSATYWRRRSGAGPLRPAAGVWPGQARDAAAVLSRVRFPFRVQRRMPKEPHPSHTGWRAGPQLAL